MTRLALFTGISPQQVMFKVAYDMEAFNPRMVTMAGKTILLHQLLMEGRTGQRFFDRHPEGCQPANILRLMTRCTAVSGRPDEWRMTGKAIRFELAVPRNQFAGSNHQMGINEGQNGQHNQVGR